MVIGTGKTTTARKIGQVYYDMGLLSSVDVVEVSASDLVGQYVGHTGPKTKKQFDKALGKVLFIDEAYRLAEGHFAKECMDEIVGLLTQDRYRGKMIVILAGYDADMNELMSVNSGLSSRFPEEIVFRSIPAPQCLWILQKKLAGHNVVIHELDDIASHIYLGMISLIESLSVIPSWGNARDIETLAKQMTTLAYSDGQHTTHAGPIVLAGSDALRHVKRFLASRQERTSNLPNTRRGQSFNPLFQPPPSPPSQPTVDTSVAHASSLTTSQSTQDAEDSDTQHHCDADGDVRDPGVDDAAWAQLQVDKRAAEDAEKCAHEEMLRLERDVEEKIRQAQKEVEAARIASLQAKVAQEQDRLRELARLADLKAREQAELLQRARALQEQQRQQEVKVQQKLRQMGLCVAGFRWIKQSHGYTCSAGGHIVTNAQLGL